MGRSILSPINNCLRQSQTFSGATTYTWSKKRHINEVTLSPLPNWVLPSESQKSEANKNLDDIATNGTKAGDRNNSLAQVIGRFIRNGCASLDEAIHYGLTWNEKNQPPLSESEVERTVKSIWDISQKGQAPSERTDDRSNQMDILMYVCDSLHIFRDQHNEVFVNIEGDCVPLAGSAFRQLIQYKCWTSHTMRVSHESVKQLVDILSAKAKYEGDQITLNTRVGRTRDAFWYDLGNKRAVRITPQGWIIQTPPELFRRYGHQSEQVTPVIGGNPFDLLSLTNVSQDQQLLTMVMIIATFIPDIAHPIFHPHGAQGSGKSTFCRLIKKLCDPATTELLLLPQKSEDLIHALNQHHVPIFDNVTKVSQEQSNILCTACTGGGIQKRRFYTDNDLISYNFKRCIGINGINIAFNKPDVIDRTILIGLDRISPDDRKEEEELWNTFDAIKPSILGGIFDILSKAMAVYPTISLKWKPRLADFARWGFAIAEAIEPGHGNQFMAAYQKNIERQNNEVMHQNTLLQAVTDIMSDKDGPWETTIADCWTQLYELVGHEHRNDYTFPSSDKQLRKKLEEIRANLLDYGINYKISEKRVQSAFKITIWKVDQSCASSASCA